MLHQKLSRCYFGGKENRPRSTQSITVSDAAVSQCHLLPGFMFSRAHQPASCKDKKLYNMTYFFRSEMADKWKKNVKLVTQVCCVCLLLGVVCSFTGHRVTECFDKNWRWKWHHTLCFEEIISQNTTACLWEILGHHVRHHSHNINDQIKEYFFWRKGVLSLP